MDSRINDSTFVKSVCSTYKNAMLESSRKAFDQARSTGQELQELSVETKAVYAKIKPDVQRAVSQQFGLTVAELDEVILVGSRNGWLF